MNPARPRAAVLVLALAACLEVNPGYLGPTTGTTIGTSDATTDGTTADASGSSTTAAAGAGGCGDGVVDPGEACDDGRDGDQDDGCTDLCALPACGDDFVQASLGEECDEGSFNADDGACTSLCAAARCGDGLVRAGEACDDGNQVGEDGCEADCTTLAITELAIGNQFVCALLSHGKVRCWGYNIAGQLGLGDFDNRGDGPGELPTAYVETGGTVVDLAAAVGAVCALLDVGAVRCWGGSTSGELGSGSFEPIGDGPGELPPDTVHVGESARALAGGGGFFCAVTHGDDVRCWGNNTWGQLGLLIPWNQTGNLGDEPGELPTEAVPLDDVPVALAAGTGHVCARTAAGEAYCWGLGEQGQLGYESPQNLGSGAEDLPTVPVLVDAVDADVVQIVVGDGHTCALRGSQQVRCWGSGMDGRLGTGDTVSIGDAPGTMPPPDVPLGGDVVQIAAGAFHTCALMAGGAVRCWGLNTEGQLGVGSPADAIGDDPGEMPPADVPLGGLATAIYAGGSNSCAVLEGGAVRCWGENSQGQLGIGSTATIGDDETPDAAPTTPVLP